VQVLPYGTTEVPRWLLEEQLQGMHPQFSAETYHLLENNCNTFAHELATFLTGRGLPDHIVELPAEFMSSPLGAMFTPMIDAMFRGSGSRGAPL